MIKQACPLRTTSSNKKPSVARMTEIHQFCLNVICKSALNMQGAIFQHQAPAQNGFRHLGEHVLTPTSPSSLSSKPNPMDQPDKSMSTPGRYRGFGPIHSIWAGARGVCLGRQSGLAVPWSVWEIVDLTLAKSPGNASTRKKPRACNAPAHSSWHSGEAEMSFCSGIDLLCF